MNQEVFIQMELNGSQYKRNYMPIIDLNFRGNFINVADTENSNIPVHQDGV